MEKLKYIVALLLVFMAFLCCGCTSKEYAAADRFDTEPLAEAYDTRFAILTDKESGVQYLYMKNGSSAVIQVLVDAEGKPLVEKGE